MWLLLYDSVCIFVTQGSLTVQEAGTTVRDLKLTQYDQDAVELDYFLSLYSSTQYS